MDENNDPQARDRTMANTTRMTNDALAARKAMLADAVAEHGHDVVEAWADDPVKVRIINAMAQLTADDAAGRQA